MTSLQNLFVAKLPRNLTDNDLEQVFAAFHPTSAKVMLDAASGKSKGFGFVLFNSEEEGQRAYEALNKTHATLHGHSFTLCIFPSKHDGRVAMETSNALYIRNIPQTLTQDKVEEALRTFGELTYCAMREDHYGNAVWVVYAEFASEEIAKRAMESLHGNKTLFDSVIPVLAKYADSDETKKERRRRREQGNLLYQQNYLFRQQQEQEMMLLGQLPPSVAPFPITSAYPVNGNLIQPPTFAPSESSASSVLAAAVSSAINTTNVASAAPAAQPPVPTHPLVGFPYNTSSFETQTMTSLAPPTELSHEIPIDTAYLPSTQPFQMQNSAQPFTLYTNFASNIAPPPLPPSSQQLPLPAHPNSLLPSSSSTSVSQYSFAPSYQYAMTTAGQPTPTPPPPPPPPLPSFLTSLTNTTNFALQQSPFAETRNYNQNTIYYGDGATNTVMNDNKVFNMPDNMQPDGLAGMYISNEQENAEADYTSFASAELPESTFHSMPRIVPVVAGRGAETGATAEPTLVEQGKNNEIQKELKENRMINSQNEKLVATEQIASMHLYQESTNADIANNNNTNNNNINNNNYEYNGIAETAKCNAHEALSNNMQTFHQMNDYVTNYSQGEMQQVNNNFINVNNNGESSNNCIMRHEGATMTTIKDYEKDNLTVHLSAFGYNDNHNQNNKNAGNNSSNSYSYDDLSRSSDKVVDIMTGSNSNYFLTSAHFCSSNTTETNNNDDMSSINNISNNHNNHNNDTMNSVMNNVNSCNNDNLNINNGNGSANQNDKLNLNNFASDDGVSPIISPYLNAQFPSMSQIVSTAASSYSPHDQQEFFETEHPGEFHESEQQRKESQKSHLLHLEKQHYHHQREFSHHLHFHNSLNQHQSNHFSSPQDESCSISNLWCGEVSTPLSFSFATEVIREPNMSCMNSVTSPSTTSHEWMSVRHKAPGSYRHNPYGPVTPVSNSSLPLSEENTPVLSETHVHNRHHQHHQNHSKLYQENMQSNDNERVEENGEQPGPTLVEIGSHNDSSHNVLPEVHSADEITSQPASVTLHFISPVHRSKHSIGSRSSASGHTNHFGHHHFQQGRHNYVKETMK